MLWIIHVTGCRIRASGHMCITNPNCHSLLKNICFLGRPSVNWQLKDWNVCPQSPFTINVNLTTEEGEGEIKTTKQRAGRIKPLWKKEGKEVPKIWNVPENKFVYRLVAFMYKISAETQFTPYVPCHSHSTTKCRRMYKMEIIHTFSFYLWSNNHIVYRWKQNINSNSNVSRYPVFFS